MSAITIYFGLSAGFTNARSGGAPPSDRTFTRRGIDRRLDREDAAARSVAGVDGTGPIELVVQAKLDGLDVLLDVGGGDRIGSRIENQNVAGPEVHEIVFELCRSVAREPVFDAGARCPTPFAAGTGRHCCR